MVAAGRLASASEHLVALGTVAVGNAAELVSSGAGLQPAAVGAADTRQKQSCHEMG